MTGTTSATHPHTEMDTEQLHSICLFDVNTFELLHVIELPSHEYALSIASVKLGPQSNQLYFVVGTAIFNPDDPECKQVGFNSYLCYCFRVVSSFTPERTSV